MTTIHFGTTETDAEILKVKELSGSDDPPYDFPWTIPGISPTLGVVDLKDYVERLKSLSFEGNVNEDEDIKRTPPRDPDQNGTPQSPHFPGHFPLPSDVMPPGSPMRTECTCGPGDVESLSISAASPVQPSTPQALNDNANFSSRKSSLQSATVDLDADTPKVTDSTYSDSRKSWGRSAATRNSDADISKPHWQVPTPDSDNGHRTTLGSASAAINRRDSPDSSREGSSEENFASQISSSVEESQDDLPITWSGRAISATKTRMYWTMSDSRQDLPHPTIPGAALGHIHLHRNSFKDHVQVWLLESESTWVDYSPRYGSLAEPFIKHPIFTALVLTTRGRKRAPSWVTVPYLRKKMDRSV